MPTFDEVLYWSGTDLESAGSALKITSKVLADLAKVSKKGFLLQQEERDAAVRLVEETGTKTPSIDQVVRNLSGGNQQKVVLGKWLFRDAEVLIFDEQDPHNLGTVMRSAKSRFSSPFNAS